MNGNVVIANGFIKSERYCRETGGEMRPRPTSVHPEVEQLPEPLASHQIHYWWLLACVFLPMPTLTPPHCLLVWVLFTCAPRCFGWLALQKSIWMAHKASVSVIAMTVAPLAALTSQCHQLVGRGRKWAEERCTGRYGPGTYSLPRLLQNLEPVLHEVHKTIAFVTQKKCASLQSLSLSLLYDFCFPYIFPVSSCSVPLPWLALKIIGVV